MDIPVLVEARNETGVSWASVARQMKIADETLRTWRKGITKIQQHRWRQLARAIGIDPDEFDRSRYNREFAALQREKAPQTPLGPKKGPTPPEAPTPAPDDEEDGIFDSWFGAAKGGEA